MGQVLHGSATFVELHAKATIGVSDDFLRI